MLQTLRSRVFLALSLFALTACGAPEEDGPEPIFSDAADDAGTVEGDATEPDTRVPDAAEPDTGEPDTGEPDTGEPDTGEPDTGEPDTGEPDTGEPDAAEPDTSVPDAAELDTSEPDTGEPDATEPTTGSVRICMLPSEAGIPNETFPAVVANGSWNDWAGWGVELTGPDTDGRYCGVVSGLEPGTYQYLHAGTGPIDEWSGWGTTGNAPLGSDCDFFSGDEYGNYGFTIVAGEEASTCNAWDACGCEGGGLSCAEAPGREVPVILPGRQILIDGVPQHWKGVSWAPTPIGAGPGSGPHWATFVEEDADLMQAAGINLVKTYGPILDRGILDTLWAHGIAVLPTVFYGGGNSAASAVEAACAVKDHPAIVGWVVGNEWNYNRLDRDISGEEAERVVESISAALQDFDSTRPIITVYGGLPSPATLARLDEVDVWGLNVYTGPSFYELFADWEARSAAPMFLAEYGADAYDGRIGSENEAYQADVTRSLTNEIFAHAANSGSGVCSGGTIFEWNDEWWKFNGGGWDTHDTTPSWDNGAYADPGMHEEWWGLVRIDRTTREAYDVYASLTPPELGDGSGGGGGPVITTGAVEICAQVVDGEVPRAGYSVLVANGSWNDWAGFGLELTDGDGDGRFCGVLESMVPGDYEFVFAQTGVPDGYSGWGEAANAPLGSDCDWNPTDEFANWGFTIVAGSNTSVCHGWGRCGCTD